MKKTLSILMVLCLVAGTALANGKTDGASEGGMVQVTAPGQLPIVNEPATLQIMTVQSARVQDLETNSATLALAERTGIDLDMMVVLNEAAEDKKKLLLASGDYPEVMMVNFTNEEVSLYGAQQGIFQPMNDLIEEYGSSVPERWMENKALKAAMTLPDGNVYGLPGVNLCYHCWFSQKMWMNVEWLERVGLDLPTTTAEFKEALMAFKEQDANGNGDPNDEIPLSGAYKTWHADPQHFLMCAFIYDDGNYFFEVKNGKLSFVANQPEWKEGLAYMNSLYEEGLIDVAAFTQNQSQLKALGDNPDDQVLGAYSAGHVAMGVTMTDDPANDRHKNYLAVEPLTGPKGVKTTAYYNSVTGAKYVITDKAKNPALAYRLGDYLWSDEGTILMEEGPAGEAYVEDPEGVLDFMGKPAKWMRKQSFDSGGAVQNSSWMQTACTYRGSEFDGYRGFWGVDQDIMMSMGYELRLFVESRDKYEGNQPDEWFSAVYLPLDKIEEAAQLKTNVTDYVKEAMVRFITGDMDIDKDWDSYVDTLKGYGSDDYLQIYGDAYASMK